MMRKVFQIVVLAVMAFGFIHCETTEEYITFNLTFLDAEQKEEVKEHISTFDLDGFKTVNEEDLVWSFSCSSVFQEKELAKLYPLPDQMKLLEVVNSELIYSYIPEAYHNFISPYFTGHNGTTYGVTVEPFKDTLIKQAIDSIGATGLEIPFELFIREDDLNNRTYVYLLSKENQLDLADHLTMMEVFEQDDLLQVDFYFDDTGAEEIAAFIDGNVGKYVAYNLIDGMTTIPLVNGPIAGDKFSISGKETVESFFENLLLRGGSNNQSISLEIKL